MKLALVSSSYLPHPGDLERHVHELALGLTLRGVAVEVLTQDLQARLPSVSEFDGFVVRRFSAPFRSSHFAVAPGLWEHLRRSAPRFDLIHAHSPHASLALAAARARPRRLVFTPHAPVQRLLRRPYGPVIRALIGHGAQILCTARAEREILRGMFPQAADRIGAVEPGVELAAIETARPFAYPGIIVLAAGYLERHRRIDRAIAAMAALDPTFRLAVVGDGPERERLLAHAADLHVSSRVKFVGSVADAELYRWMRTARVVVALADQEFSGLHIAEALSAGAPVVMSDIPVHREVASHTASRRVRFVPAAGSPLDVADEISEAVGLGVADTSRQELPTWDDTVERTLAVYSGAVRGNPRLVVGPA